MEKMCRIMVHRGPDSCGTFSDADIELGIQRLSIIDVKDGDQPIHNEDESIWIVFNGEIYNYLELKKELEILGHRFSTASDTEVVVHAYEEFGQSCVRRLRGMFAFSIWDGRRKELFLARDRVGIKPLYYTFSGSGFLFASEIKSILQFDEVERELNKRAAYHYLTLRYVPGPNTMFKGIWKLPPAHTAVLRRSSITMSRYWEFGESPAKLQTEAYYKESLLALLRDAVKVSLMSEVPLGVFLSGGLDSSVVASLASQSTDQAIDCFTIGFGQEDDEFRYAEEVASFIDADLHEFTVSGDMLDILPEVIWHLDEPLADPTVIPTYAISEWAKKYITVALTGEGGDELFSGYEHEKAMLRVKTHRLLFSALAKTQLYKMTKIVPVSLLDSFFQYPSSMGEMGKERLVHFLASYDDKALSYTILASTFTEDEKNELLSSLEDNTQQSSTLFKPYFDDTNPMTKQMLSINCNMWLPDYILLRLDKMTAASSVEGRVPLLDHILIEFSAEVPEHLKLSGSTEKYLLRKVAMELVPSKIVKRKKRTFITPIHRWGEKKLLELCSQLFSESNLTGGFFKHGYVNQILRQYHGSKLIVGRQLWTLLTFELWRRIYFENEDLSHPRLSLNNLV